jgi:serine/threonine-protein kinase
MAMSPGTIVGGYRIERVLGAGGMGTVYLAKHPSLPRMDAIKVLSGELSSNDEFRGRFEREANLAAGLDHPNIVSVYNRGEENGQLWIAMQYVDGTDASAELARDPHAMTPLRALRIVTEVGKGLDYAHRRGLLHRDVKPANFLLSKSDNNEEERILLTDFGVAKSTEDASELTQTGSFVATIAYAPPEQLQGLPVDKRGDIYSLACAFFKLLTGRNPYPAAQPAMVMMGHLYEPPPRATAVNPHLPQGLDHVFARAMAKNPRERFDTCREFTDAATSVLVPGYKPVSTSTSPTHPIQVFDPRPSTDPRAAIARTGVSDPRGNRSDYHSTDFSSLAVQKPSGRRKWVLGAAAGVVAAGLAVGIGVFATSGGGGKPTSTTANNSVTSAAVATVTSAAQARGLNPQLAGKTITVIDVTNDATDKNNLAIYLSGSPQAKFMENLGFVYNLNYTKQGDEPSPRPLTGDFAEIQAAADSYILAVRSDKNAGGGGLLGLPYPITNSRATVVPLDDPTAVSALRNWGADSEQVMLQKLVPVLHNRITK